MKALQLEREKGPWQAAWRRGETSAQTELSPEGIRGGRDWTVVVAASLARSKVAIALKLTLLSPLE